MVNKEGKLFGKISIIDILVIIVIFAAALGVYARFFAPAKVGETETKKFIYTVKLENLSQNEISALLKKGAVYDSETGKKIGEIQEISEPCAMVETGVNSRGNGVLVELSDSFAADVKIKTAGSENEGEYYTENEKKIIFGDSIEFETKYIKSKGIVIDVSQN